MTATKKLVALPNVAQIKEAKVIKEAIAAGFLNPYDDIDLAQTMHFKVNKKWQKQAIEEFGYIKYKDVKLSQVRKIQQDWNHVKDSLSHQFDSGKPNAYYGLKNPIIIDRGDVLQHGHHRLATLFYLSNNNDEVLIPFFRVSGVIFDSDADGNEIQHSPHGSYSKLIAKIKPNPPKKNKEYKMEDIANQAIEAYRCDSSLGGLNASKNPWDKNLLETWMDDVHPNQFTDSRTRGKILSIIERKNSSVVVKTSNFADFTNMLASQGMPIGIIPSKGGKKLKRKAFLQNCYPNNKFKIAQIKTDRAKDFERDLVVNLFYNADLEVGSINPSGFFEIELVSEIAIPSANKSELDTQREHFLVRVKKANESLKQHGRKVKFTKVVWMPQLVNVETAANPRIDSL